MIIVSPLMAIRRSLRRGSSAKSIKASNQSTFIESIVFIVPIVFIVYIISIVFIVSIISISSIISIVSKVWGEDLLEVWRKSVVCFQKSRVVEKCPKRAKTVEKEALLKKYSKKTCFITYFLFQ